MRRTTLQNCSLPLILRLEKRLCLSSTSQGLAFSPPIVSPTTGPATVMAAGDFDRDGNVDLLVRASNESFLRLYAGAGNGKFVPAGPAILAGASPSAIVVADFNKDGKLDAAVANNPGS